MSIWVVYGLMAFSSGVFFNLGLIKQANGNKGKAYLLYLFGIIPFAVAVGWILTGGA